MNYEFSVCLYRFKSVHRPFSSYGAIDCGIDIKDLYSGIIYLYNRLIIDYELLIFSLPVKAVGCNKTLFELKLGVRVARSPFKTIISFKNVVHIHLVSLMRQNFIIKFLQYIYSILEVPNRLWAMPPRDI
jgi:hypothetical protein